MEHDLELLQENVEKCESCNGKMDLWNSKSMGKIVMCEDCQHFRPLGRPL